MTRGGSDKARIFAGLHRPGDPLVLFNVWDAGSAKAVAEAGADAIATGSWSVAAAHGLPDGEALPLDLVLANAARIVAAVDLPVTIDFEGAYAAAPNAVAEHAARLAGTGAVGCNFEDGQVGGEGLFAPEAQAERIAAMRAAAGPDFFINARTDLFLKQPLERHGEAVEAALERGRLYAAAGADGLFVPGVTDEALIARICQASPLPVNVMVWKGTPPLRRLAELDVARISHAAAPWRLAMKALARAARAAHELES